MIDQGIRRRFEEMLPWYVNGTLERESRQWFETQLATHPELRSELEFTETIQARVQASVPQVAPDLGLDTLMSRIHAERASAPSPARPARSQAAATPGLMARLTAFLEGFRLTPAFATAAAVIAVQAGIIGVLVSNQPDGGVDDPAYSGFRSAGDGVVVTGPLLEVAFNADAREREIRALLVEVGGTLAGGPGQLGQYMVYVPADRIADTLRVLEASPIVDAVEIVPDSATPR